MRDPPRIPLPLELVYALSVNIDNLRVREWNVIVLMCTTKSALSRDVGVGNKGIRRHSAIICRGCDRPLAKQPRGGPLHIEVGLRPDGERGSPVVPGCECVVRRLCRPRLGEVERSPKWERRYRTRTGSIPKQRGLLPSPRGCLLPYLGRLHRFSLASVPMSVLGSMPHHTDSGRC